MMHYTISPQAKDSAGQTLYLTADYPTGWVVVKELVKNQNGATDPSQLWTPIGNISPGGVGFMLLNSGGSNGDVVISAPSSNALVKLAPSDSSGAAFWVLIDNGGYGALQLQSDTDMNLNVMGDGPYANPTQVAVWDWSKGQPNEVWSATYQAQ